MGQIISSAAKPKRCNISQLSQLGTPAAGEHILVSSDNSMNANGQGNFDAYVVGDGTTAATELELKQIEDIFDEITLHQSTNLFDISQSTSGAYYWNSGPADNASWSYSGFIPVEEGKTYQIQRTYNGVRGATPTNFIVGHDANKNRLTSYSKSNATSYTIPVGSGIKYVIFSFQNVDANRELAFVEGTDVLPYEAYYAPYYTKGKIKESLLPYVSFEKIAFKTAEVGKNKLNPSEIGIGWIQMTTGNVLGGDNYRYTPYIEASKKGLFFNKPYADISSGIGNAVYDSSKTYKRGFVGGAYVYEEGDAYVRWTMNLSSYNEGELQVEEGSVATAYEPFAEKEVIDPDVLPSSTIDANTIAESLKLVKIFGSAIKISLPDKIFAVVGDTLQVFYQGFVKCVNIENYNVLITCSKGKQYHRYFEYTPSASDVGTTTFGVAIYDNNRNVLGSASCALVTLAQPSAPSSEKKFMCVGDSLTANGVWVAEAYRRLTGSGGTPAGLSLNNITFGGSKTKDGAGYIGLSGWGWYDFVSNSRAAFRFTLSGSPSLSMGAKYSNNGHNYEIIEIIDNTILCETSSTSNTPTTSGTLTKVSGSGDATLTFTSVAADAANPFWDGSKVSFTTYVNNYLGGSVDYVYTLLSWNGMGGTISSIMERVKTFADALHRDYPNAKLRLMGLQFPSMKLMMPAYGASGNGYADTYAMYIKAIELQEAFKEFANSEGYSTWVEHINVATEFDSEYNMPITQKNVNTRNSTYQEPYANNGVHPGDAGYLQIGDVAYRSIVNDLNEA